MDLNPEDIAKALSAEPGPQAKHPLWDAYWKEVGRWAPWLSLAVPAPMAKGAYAIAPELQQRGANAVQSAIDLQGPAPWKMTPYDIAVALQKSPPANMNMP